MLERLEELVDGAWTKGVAALGTVEGHPHRAVMSGAVVGHVLEGKSGDFLPLGGIEQVRYVTSGCTRRLPWLVASTRVEAHGSEVCRSFWRNAVAPLQSGCFPLGALLLVDCRLADLHAESKTADEVEWTLRGSATK